MGTYSKFDRVMVHNSFRLTLVENSVGYVNPNFSSKKSRFFCQVDVEQCSTLRYRRQTMVQKANTSSRIVARRKTIFVKKVKKNPKKINSLLYKNDANIYFVEAFDEGLTATTKSNTLGVQKTIVKDKRSKWSAKESVHAISRCTNLSPRVLRSGSQQFI